jgi:hypothetical protein
LCKNREGNFWVCGSEKPVFLREHFPLIYRALVGS